MMTNRPLSKFFLTLYIVLLSGMGQVYAHSFEKNTFSAPSKNRLTTGFNSLDNVMQDNSLVIKRHSSGKENNLIFEETDKEEEEDEHDTNEKHLEGGNYFIALFDNAIIGSYSDDFDNLGLYSNEQITYTASCGKYIVLRVIRI